MKRPAPPRSLSSIAEAALGPKPKLLPEVEVHFQDEFAPSAARFNISDPSLADDPAVRQTFYNDQALGTFEDAVSRAVDLGMPFLFNGFPLQFTAIDDLLLAQIRESLARVLPSLKEGTHDWLCVQCYLRWFQACFHFTEGASVNIIADAMFFAGAAAREIELSKLNRSAARTGRKQRKVLADHRETAHAKQRETVKARQDAIAILLSETRLTSGALENHLRKRLLERFAIKVSTRTIRRDLTEKVGQSG